MNREKLLQQMTGLTLILLLLVGCGGPEATPVSEAPAATMTSAPPKATPTPVPPKATPTSVSPTPTTETAVSFEFFDGRIGITVTKVETTQDLPADYGLPSAGGSNTYVSIHMNVTRIEGVHLVNILGFGEESSILNDHEGQSYDLVFGTFRGVQYKDPSDIRSPSELIVGAEGVLVFEIPEDRNPASLDLIYSYQESWEDDSPKERGEMTIAFE